MAIRQNIGRFLESFDWYLNIRYSYFFLKFWKKKHASVDPILKKEKAYYLNLLDGIKSDKKNIFDVGANEGFISDFFLEEKFKVIAIEPDKRNQRILESRFKKKKLFKLIKKGVSDQEKTAPFFIHKRNSALNTFSPKWKNRVEGKNQSEGFSEEQNLVELTTLDQIIKEEGLPNFIKIDVEGHELEVINGLSLKIPLLSFEANFPEFKEETFLIIKKLEQICGESRFNFSIDYKLIFPAFMDRLKLEKELDKINDEVCLEIICKMSNYPHFFN